MDFIFKIWPTVAAMAEAIDVRAVNVRSWKNRGSIPAKYDSRIIEAAKAAGVKVTHEELAKARAE